MLALRDMAEQMVDDVQWDASARLATIQYKEKTITLQPDLQRVFINNEQQQIDVGPQIIEDRFICRCDTYLNCWRPRSISAAMMMAKR